MPYVITKNNFEGTIDVPNLTQNRNFNLPNASGNLVVDSQLSAVALSGSYNDLKNKPSIPSTPNAYVTASWRSGNNWYLKFSNGLIMQGGHFNGRANGVSLHVAFTTANYAAFWIVASIHTISAKEQTTTYLGSSSTVSTARDVIWFAVGY